MNKETDKDKDTDTDMNTHRELDTDTDLELELELEYLCKIYIRRYSLYQRLVQYLEIGYHIPNLV
jgi:hypothetical protein